ncbi:MAG: type VI secretion system protein TssA [Methylococcaceae bacterium]|nr:type VI secretion system protein TssA [Methylococcaceae bacterium]
MLDIASLLQEISPLSPCGDDLEYDAAFIALQQKAKGTPEKQIGELIEPAQPPNWKEVRKELLELMQRTRDLRLLLEMVRTSLNLDGVPGLKESLELLRLSLETYWDTLHPQLDPDDDNDPTLRVNILMGLCDGGSMLRPLHGVALVESRAFGRFSLRDIHIACGKLPALDSDQEAPSLSSIHAAFVDADPELLQRTQADLDASLVCIRQIEDFVTDQVGVGNAPNFAPLRDEVKEVLSALNEQMARCGLGGAVGVAADQAAPGMTSPVLPASGQLGTINSRQDVIRALDLICDYYDQHEPSSPVPLLARRAKRLVSLDFMAIMQDLAPEGLAQIQMIKGQEAEGES